MNKLWLTLLFLSLWSSACGTKQVTQSSAVDQEKLEQIKKLITEQAQQTQTGSSGGSNQTDPLDPKAYVSLAVRPAKFEITEGLIDDTLRVIATQRNGEERTLSRDVSFQIEDESLLEIIDDEDSARFDIKALKPGTTKVTAAYDKLSIEFSVEIKAPQIQSIEIVPKAISLGVPTRFRLSAQYDNLTQADISDGIVWQSNSTSYLQGAADSGTTGIFTGYKVGSVGLKAEYQGMSIVSRTQIQMPAIRSIQVTADSNTFLLGTYAPVQAIATFQNNNSFDITSSVNWSVNDPVVGVVNSQGMLDALYPGELVVRAQYGDVFGEETFNISSVNFASFRLSPPSASFPLGMSQNFKLYGVLADNTEQDITAYARWTSSNDLVAKAGGMDEPPVRGLYSAVQKGTAVALAKYGSTTLQANITVTDAALASLTIKTDNPEGVCGVNNPQFTAEGLLSDNSSKDMTAAVTWSVEPAEAAIPSTDPSQPGLILTKQVGTATVTASYFETATQQLITASATINIQTAVVTGVGITAPQSSLAIGQSVQMSAGQIMSCGTGADYTTQVTWSSSDPSLVTMSNASGTKGLLTTSGSISTPTTVTISAIGGGFNGTFEMEIRPKEVEFISVVPVQNALIVGTGTTTATVNATFTDGSVENMTNIASYPGYTLQYYLTDCATTGCGSIHATSGLVTAGSLEGLIKPRAVLTTPQGKVIISPSASIKVVSKCTGTGTLSGYYCVFLSAKGASCDQTCSATGRTYHPATLSVYGSGGDPMECSNALYDLGYIRKLETDKFNHGLGLGCSIWTVPALNIQQSVRETATPTSSSDSDPDFERVCACRET
ncbi:Ig-like domain-containing protein [Oligoflexus tunisiensis]|uniref:Ig-like domain-containing protein n=1 Tax=Oligoflexus tunisiensis TaxID=708132 RepID=UPI00159F1A88|nr:Ig-like domain-containing protein [Oligoflexus tunisiensis]